MLKKIVVLYTALIATLMLLTSPAVAQKMIPSPPELAAKAWILVDAQTGQVLVENNADQPLPPASLAKMMTTYIVSGEIAAGRLNDCLPRF